MDQARRGGHAKPGPGEIVGEPETTLPGVPAPAINVNYALGKDGSLLVRQGLDLADDVVLSPTPEAKTGDRVVVEGARP